MSESFPYPFPPIREHEWSLAFTHGFFITTLVLLIIIIIGQHWLKPRLWQLVLWIPAVWMISFYVAEIHLEWNSQLRELLRIYRLCALFLTAAGTLDVIGRRQLVSPSGANVLFAALAIVPAILGYLHPGVTTSREVARRVQCRNQLKQIGLALYNYHDLFETLPSGPIQAEPVTWRIALLPFIDQSELFGQYHFDQRWDGTENQQLLDHRPLDYYCPSHWHGSSHLRSKHIASYVALTGTGTLWDQEQPTLKLRDITDGSSNTIGIVEAAGLNPIWMAPDEANLDELPLAINQPGAQRGESHGAMSSYHRDMVHILFMDGSVKRLSEKTDPAILKALSTPNGGETIPKEW